MLIANVPAPPVRTPVPPPSCSSFNAAEMSTAIKYQFRVTTNAKNERKLMSLPGLPACLLSPPALLLPVYGPRENLIKYISK